MKKITIYVFSLLFSLSLVAQDAKKKNNQENLSPENARSLEETGFVKCSSTEYEAYLAQQHPERATNDQFENWMANKIEEVKQQRLANPDSRSMVVISIPVVVHVVHSGQPIGVAPNITDAQVISQITAMNEDFRKLSGTPGDGTGVDVEIEFCLAQQDPSGNPSNGINRYDSTALGLTWSGPGGTTDTVLKPATIWDPTSYMNMWSVQFSDPTLLGYAQFPNASGLPGLNTNNGGANSDGVVAAYSTFGDIGSNDGTFLLNAPFDRGRTMTHEVGHYLGLRHIWGDANCGDDFCADTPTQQTASGGNCPATTTCDSVADLTTNYMDYSNDSCMNNFTQNQKDRMLVVMANSPRRMELSSSNKCNSSTVPFINISPGTPSPNEIAEGSDCNFQDYTIDLTISLGGSATSTVTLVNSGTATDNEDFMLMNNSVTFAAGSTTPSNAVTLRVFNDNFVEADETIELSLNIATTGDATASTSQVSSTIINDDSVVTSNGNAVIFSDGFETYTDFDITPVGGWTMLDNDGDGTYGSNTTTWTNSGYTGTFMVFNPSQTSPSLAGSIWDPNSGDKGYYCFNATGNVSGTPLNDDYIFTPQISLNGTNSELKFFAKSITDQYGLERFQVGVSTTDTNPSSFTYITPSPYEQAPITWTEYTYDLSAYDGQDIYITFHVVSADAFAFMLDDVSVTADVNTLVQTDVNTATPDQVNLTAAGQAYSSDVSTGNIMLDIDNTGGFAHGCTTVAVSRDATTAGAAAVSYAGGTDVAGFVTAKTFDITTTNASSSDASTINFYFTEAEIAAWETATGNNRSALQVKKEGTNEVVPVTISAFGTDLILSASFTTGIADTYYFGSQLAFLSVNNFELASTLSIYPNPSVGVLTIKAANDNDLPSAYKVYNMLGQLITENNINNTQDLTIDTTPFSNGMYFIKISKAGNAVTFPFIKK